MSKVTELQKEIKELKEFVDKRVAELNEKYSTNSPNGIAVFVMPDPLHHKLIFCVDLNCVV
ncbi:MAG: hypothetical protein KG003_14310 [Bacteroidetes bacterium]|nr:hypothetical protein [Bacteroidota bacterium]